MPRGHVKTRRLKQKPEVKKPREEAEIVDIKTWPTRSEAAQILGVNPRTIKRWEDNGELDSAVDDLGYHRFDPKDLDAMRTSRGGDAEAMGQALSAIVDGATNLTGQAQTHADNFAGKIISIGEHAFDAMKETLDLVKDENVSLRTYIRELEGDRREAFKEAENARGKQHERKIEADKIEREEKRIDWALGVLAAVMGPVIMKKLGSSSDLKMISSGPTIGEAEKSEEAKENSEVVTTVGRLRELELNVILLIGNMDKQKFDGLVMFANAEEKKALLEIRETVEKLRTKAEPQKGAAQGD